jgi:glycerophosphoryl diester phosphodiesterase
MNRPVIVGHRGAREMAPENTLKAFQIGCRWADLVECDVHLSQDGKLMVSHDGSLERTAGVAGEIKNLTLEKLKEYDVGQGEKIPELWEVAELVKESNRGLIIEIKGDSDEEALSIADALYEFVSKNDLPEKIYICSFWHSILKAFKKGVLPFQTFILINDDRPCDELVKSVKLSGADGIGIRCNNVAKECVAKLHQGGYFVNAWVVNDEKTLEEMLDAGADWITTDYPQKISRLI